MRRGLLLAGLGLLALSFVVTVVTAGGILEVQSTGLVAAAVWLVMSTFWLGIVCVAGAVLALVRAGDRPG